MLLASFPNINMVRSLVIPSLSEHLFPFPTQSIGRPSSTFRRPRRPHKAGRPNFPKLERQSFQMKTFQIKLQIRLLWKTISIECFLWAKYIDKVASSLDACFHLIQLCKYFMEVRFKPVSNLSRNIIIIIISKKKLWKKINNKKTNLWEGGAKTFPTAHYPYGRQARDSNGR